MYTDHEPDYITSLQVLLAYVGHPHQSLSGHSHHQQAGPINRLYLLIHLIILIGPTLLHVCLCVYVCACVRTYVHVCVRVCARIHVRVQVGTLHVVLFTLHR